MIDLATIDGFVDEHARALTRQYPGHAPTIAQRTAAAKERILKLAIPVEGVPSFPTVSAVFDVCEGLDDVLHSDDEKIARRVAEARDDTMDRMLRVFYERKEAARPSESRSISREETIARLLAEALPLLRKTMPMGMFGPEWFEDHCDAGDFEELQSFAYSFEHDRLDWSRVRDLLPAALRSQFDPIDNSDVPTEIQCMDDALVVLGMFQRRGYTKAYLLDPANLTGHLQTQPHFRRLIEFFAVRAEGTDQALSPDSPIA